MEANGERASVTASSFCCPPLVRFLSPFSVSLLLAVTLAVQHGFTCNWGQRTPEYGCGSCGPRDGNDHNGIPLNVTAATSPSFCPNGWFPPPESGKPQAPAPEAHCPTGIPCFDNSSSCSIGGTWLFDVVADPTETANKAASNPAIVKRLMERLQSFNATNIPQDSPGIDPRSSPSHFGNVW